MTPTDDYKREAPLAKMKGPAKSLFMDLSGTLSKKLVCYRYDDDSYATDVMP